MTDVRELARELADALAGSDEYQEYLELKEKISGDEKTKKLLLDYREKLMEARSKQIQGEELDEELEQELQEIQRYVELNKPVQEYMEAEHRINELVNELHQIIFSDLEIGLEDEPAGPEVQ
ncbi:YlbF family regulator [Halarsenatibacter silvermanii]|uniref:Cell fate regulator YlbF, YheA/YmcA/DUF963 family (Controls sporulation, competence, biofilm development) n=1 Tax=Halarsenatibacter silvermanii TaxID=321763 RepID=A0A1G9NHC6_9FIRM|nr:YlbF family regulator [Halarsenatibacter silvermanii]SDL85978.1 Cell fate regulator YlbF, YheA/YmcA/DUF963 family (controls sporulation, competence, biofilm development) [Halarsenatibacter silvermanii]